MQPIEHLASNKPPVPPTGDLQIANLTASQFLDRLTLEEAPLTTEERREAFRGAPTAELRLVREVFRDALLSALREHVLELPRPPSELGALYLIPSAQRTLRGTFEFVLAALVEREVAEPLLTRMLTHARIGWLIVNDCARESVYNESIGALVPAAALQAKNCGSTEELVRSLKQNLTPPVQLVSYQSSDGACVLAVLRADRFITHFQSETGLDESECSISHQGPGHVVLLPHSASARDRVRNFAAQFE